MNLTIIKALTIGFTAAANPISMQTNWFHANPTINVNHELYPIDESRSNGSGWRAKYYKASAPTFARMHKPH